MNNYIPEVEFNCCNLCTAGCAICSKAHGSGNIPMMKPETFNVLIEQLHDVRFDLLQTSGNGDALMNQHFLSYITELRRCFPKAEINFYSNFFLLNSQWAEAIIEGRLFNKIHTRIDSLDPSVFRRMTGGLIFSVVEDNIRGFASRNSLRGNPVKFEIMYSSVRDYYNRCWRVLGRPPLYGPFDTQEAKLMFDEFANVKRHFGPGPSYARMNQSLWAEREQAPPDPETPCPKQWTFDKIIWVHPDGRIGVCGQDDTQDVLNAGDIHEQHIYDIWNGQRRREIIEKIKRREFRQYPCVNPACCHMGD